MLETGKNFLMAAWMESGLTVRDGINITTTTSILCAFPCLGFFLSLGVHNSIN